MRKYVHHWSLFILIFAGIAPCASLAQATYYVAAVGKDTNNGQSANAPFQTLTKVNSLLLQPGDSVLFRRGDVFKGTLQLKQSGSAGRPIVISDYATGHFKLAGKPVLTGSVSISHWISLGNNIWQASCAECDTQVTGLYRAGSALPLGRYPNPSAPNQGYLTVQMHVGVSQLTSQQPLSTDWTGGEVVVRAAQWILDRATIIKQAGNTLTLGNKTSTYELIDSRGYFIQNHPATLDQAGEWYYNSASKTILLFDNQGNPNKQAITATVLSRGIELADVSFIIIQNLQVKQTLRQSLYARNVSNLTLTNDDFTESGEDGVVIDGSGSHIRVERNHILNINNNGLWIGPYQNVTFQNNTLRSIGMLAGRGKGGDGQYNGLFCSAELNVSIENNRIDSIGFNGIALAHSTNTLVQRNIISNFCAVKSDGGGIYIWNGDKLPMSNIQFKSNIIYNGIGTPELPSANYVGANGIFMDECTDNVLVSTNTIFDCHGLGIYLYSVNHSKVTGNTSVNNSLSQLSMYNYSTSCQTRENIVQQNVLVSKLPSQFVASYESDGDDLTDFGLIDNNYYARPFEDAFKLRIVYNRTIGDDMTLAQWQALSDQDANSANSPLTYKQYRVGAFQATAIASDFTAGVQGWSAWSQSNNGQAAWDSAGKGRLKVSFPTTSEVSGSYMLVSHTMGAVAKAKSYLLRFEAVASAETKLQLFIRQQQAPYQTLSQRAEVLIGTNWQTYELAFTDSASASQAMFIFQLSETRQSVWFDNISLKEATITAAQPEDSIRFMYNPTPFYRFVSLAGNYRDVRNQVYYKRVILPPFTSLVLLKDTAPTPTKPLSFVSSQPAPKVGETMSFSVCLHNNLVDNANPQGKTQWTCQIPANLRVLNGAGLHYANRLLTGTVDHLLTDTTFVFEAIPTAAGTYKLTAQALPSGVKALKQSPADQSKVAADVSFFVSETKDAVVTPGETPAASTGQSSTTQPQVDLSLHMELSSRIPRLNDIISCTLWVSNTGATTATNIQLQNQLPAGLAFVAGTNWQVNANMLTTNLASLAAGVVTGLPFQARVVAPGRWINQAQVTACNGLDTDSVYGNGFTNGEDDAVQVDFRVR